MSSSTTTRRPRSLLFATGLALTLALAGSACTDDDGGGGTIVAGSDAEAGAEGPVPIHVGGSSGIAAGAAAASTEMSADSRLIAPYVLTEYVLGGDLPDLGTEAAGWRFDATTGIDEAALRRIADALGVGGDIVEVAADLGGGWRIGPDDGTAPSIWVGTDGARTWWYSPAWATEEYAASASGGVACAMPGTVEPIPVPAVDAVEPVDAVTDSAETTTVVPDETEVAVDPAVDLTGDCVIAEPEPPAGVPTAEEAEARARELFAAMGFDPEALAIDVWADDWSASVNGAPLLGGVASPLSFSLGFGAEGRLDWAGGVLGTPVEIGPYPLISVADGFARLQAGYGAWGDARALATGIGAVPVEATASGAPATATAEAPVDAEAPVSDVAVDPAACAADGPDCFVPEPVTVTIVGAELSLWSLYDTDGTMWLVPAYAFVDDNGGRYPVPAVTDEYLLVEEPTTEPPAEPTEPPAGEPGVVPGGEGGVDATGADPAAPTTTFPAGPEISPEQADTLLGLAEAEAVRVAEANGWASRVVARDGEQFAVTMDFSPTRVNLTVDGGIVTAVTVG